MKTKLLVGFVIASLVLAACGEAAPALQSAPIVGVTPAVGEGDKTTYIVYIPDLNGKSPEEVLQAGGAILLPAAGVALGTDAIGFFPDDIVVIGGAVVLVAATVCTLAEPCRAAASDVIAYTFDDIAARYQAITENAQVVLVTGVNAGVFNPQKGSLKLWGDYSNLKLTWASNGGCRFNLFGSIGPLRMQYNTPGVPCSPHGVLEAIQYFLKQISDEVPEFRGIL
jgi:ribosomal protein L12E/L44/L45/RPP1/RPP2